MGLSAYGCHNRDSVTQEQVAWTCPVIGAGLPLPKERNDDGEISDAYKLATAVRFSFVNSPASTLDLYQRGLCEYLAFQHSKTVPMAFTVTRSPSGVLLNYEATSVAGRDLTTALPVRSSLYLHRDRQKVLAAEKAEWTSLQTDFVPLDRTPIHHVPAEEALQ